MNRRTFCTALLTIPAFAWVAAQAVKPPSPPKKPRRSRPMTLSEWDALTYDEQYAIIDRGVYLADRSRNSREFVDYAVMYSVAFNYDPRVDAMLDRARFKYGLGRYVL